MISATLPVLMALSWVPALNQAQATAPIPQKADQTAQVAETITYPLTGKEIPSCCCPAK